MAFHICRAVTSCAYIQIANVESEREGQKEQQGQMGWNDRPICIRVGRRTYIPGFGTGGATGTVLNICP